MSIMDRIATSVPVNSTAGRVTSRGTHWTPRKAILSPGEIWSDVPLPIAPMAANFPPENNLTGMKVNRLTVIGYGGRKSSGGSKWVVRCACGMFCYRSAKFLKSDGAKSRGMCPQCDYLEEINSGRFAPDEAGV